MFHAIWFFEMQCHLYLMKRNLYIYKIRCCSFANNNSDSFHLYRKLFHLSLGIFVFFSPFYFQFVFILIETSSFLFIWLTYNLMLFPTICCFVCGCSKHDDDGGYIGELMEDRIRECDDAQDMGQWIAV